MVSSEYMWIAGLLGHKAVFGLSYSSRGFQGKYTGVVYHAHTVQLLSHVHLFATPWTAAWQASVSITNSWSLLKLMPKESLMPSNHLIFCHPLLLPPSIFPRIRVFSNESVLPIRWPKYWSFSFSISPSNEYSRLISFRMDWLQGWKSLQSKGLARVFSSTTVQKYQFFGSQLYLWSNSHIHTWLLEKTITLTRWTFVSKAISLLFNMLSRFVIAFLPRSKHLLISWPQSLSAAILKPKKIKSVTVSIVSPSICHEVMVLNAQYIIICLLLLNCMSCLYILDIDSLSDVWFANTSPILHIVFQSLWLFPLLHRSF